MWLYVACDIFGRAAFFSNSTGENGLYDRGERTAIVVINPKHSLHEMLWQRFGVDNAKDFFCFEVWLRGFGGDYAGGGIFAKGNFDNLSYLKRFGGSVGQGVVRRMESLSGRNQIVVHELILP